MGRARFHLEWIALKRTEDDRAGGFHTIVKGISEGRQLNAEEAVA
jgi:hypothetical protein